MAKRPEQSLSRQSVFELHQAAEEAAHPRTSPARCHKYEKGLTICSPDELLPNHRRATRANRFHVHAQPVTQSWAFRVGEGLLILLLLCLCLAITCTICLHFLSF